MMARLQKNNHFPGDGKMVEGFYKGSSQGFIVGCP